MEDKKFAFAKFALPGFAVLAFLALIVGLIGALGGPSRASVTDLQTAVTNLQTAVNGLDTSKANASDLANLQTAVTNLQTAVNGLDTSKANASDLAALAKTVSDLQTAMDSLDAASAADLIALANEVNTLGASVATLMATQEPATPAAPTEPTAAPTTGGAPAVTETPTAPVETRTELQPCPGYESKSYNGAVDGNNVTDSRDPEGFMNVKCFLIVPPANIEVEDVEAWYVSITKIEFTVVGGLPRSAFLGDGNGNVSLILDTWTYVNATTTELPVITVDVAVPGVAAPYLTVGEILSGYHPAGPGHNGYYVYIAYTVDVQALGADKALAWITTQ